jgi:hypothetical protein
MGLVSSISASASASKGFELVAVNVMFKNTSRVVGEFQVSLESSRWLLVHSTVSGRLRLGSRKFHDAAWRSCAPGTQWLKATFFHRSRTMLAESVNLETKGEPPASYKDSGRISTMWCHAWPLQKPPL